ncbi:MAG: hypothetical protein FAF04_06825 [Epsilonproteobacteria bacterium]|nr:hypothetical protein [Campylobacterota bacterium]
MRTRIDPAKKKIQSGNKIVEIIIKTEDDIREIIAQRNIDATKDNINLYGFEKQRFDCKGECLHNAQQKSSKMYQGDSFLEESIESYYRSGSYKFLIKKIMTEPLPPKNFEFYRHYIPIIKDIRYEIYLNEEQLGEGASREDVIKIADIYVKKHTPRSLFD